MQIRQEVHEGYRLPRGYGVAWFDWQTARAICYPIPLNVFVRWMRSLLFFLRCRGSRDYRTRVEEQFFNAGLEEGRKHVARDVMWAEHHQWELFHLLVMGTSAEETVIARLQEVRDRLKEKRHD